MCTALAALVSLLLPFFCLHVAFTSSHPEALCQTLTKGSCVVIYSAHTVYACKCARSLAENCKWQFLNILQSGDLLGSHYLPLCEFICRICALSSFYSPNFLHFAVSLVVLRLYCDVFFAVFLYWFQFSQRNFPLENSRLHFRSFIASFWVFCTKSQTLSNFLLEC